jgi:Inhibitor of apoptosis-promoting Bax1
MSESPAYQGAGAAARATALFIAGFGAAGYATRRDLTAVARVAFWALLALIVFGIVLIFVTIPGGALIYSVLGLVIFAGFTMFDFQRVRRSRDIGAVPLLAASIFGPAGFYDDYGLGLGRYRLPAAQVVGHHGVWGAFAFWSPELDAFITGTVNTGRVDRRPLLGAVVRALTD